jgi:hypothetical protein
MSAPPYLTAKRQVANLMSEAMALGNTIEGAVGRVFIEYWLEDDVLADEAPTSREEKLYACLAALAALRDEGGYIEDRDIECASWLVANVAFSSSQATTDVQAIVDDANTCLPTVVVDALKSKLHAHSV